jgi:hypothetical protein
MFVDAYLSVEIECNCLVGNLHVGDLDDNLLELIMVPFGQSLSHCQSSIIRFVYSSALARFRECQLTVADIQEDKLGPEMSLLSGLDDLGLGMSAMCRQLGRDN